MSGSFSSTRKSIFPSLIAYTYPVMYFIPRLESTENRHGILRTWLINENLLEAPLQSLIFLNIFPILVKGRGTDAAEFSSCQCRFEQIGRVHRSARCTGTDYGVPENGIVEVRDNITVSVDVLMLDCL